MKLIIGFSGGRDSVALVHFLYTQKVYNLVLAHMNFHLRGGESERDEAFVRRLCRERFPDAELVVKGADTCAYAAERKISIEMAARELRYEWFEELRRDCEADYIAVAHHADDQIETVLLNLARGTGGAGLTGMKAVDEERHLIRPFLSKARADIDAYIAQNDLPYVEDSTNTDEEIRRNYIRHTLIPSFEKLNPSFRKSFLRSIGFFDEEQRILEALIGEKIEGRYDPDTRSVRLLDADASASNLLSRKLFAPFGFSEDQIQSLTRAGSRSGLKFTVPGTHAVAESFRGRLFISDPADLPKPFRIIIEQGKSDHPIEGMGIIRLGAESATEDGLGGLRLSGDSIHGALILRNADSGDRFAPFGMNKGSKLLFDYLKERGIPPMYRPFCPVLVMAETNDVLAVIPLEISEIVRITPGTKKILTLSLSDPASPLARLLSSL